MVLESAISNAGFQGSKAPLAGAYGPLAGPGMASLAHTLLLQRTSAPFAFAAGQPRHAVCLRFNAPAAPPGTTEGPV